MKENYGKSAELIHKLKRDLSCIYPKIYSIKITSGKENFTRNKKEIYLSLHDEKGRFYNYNTIIYVAIHEVAHVECKDWGHTFSFYKIHERLLEEAIEKGLYNPRLPAHSNICKL